LADRRSLDSASVRALLDRADIANATLNTVAEFLDHPVLAGRERWRGVATPGGEVQALLPPATLRDVDARMDPVPALGERTEAVLRDLGHTGPELDALRAGGVI
jgi:formyl-CoA transferase